MDTVEPARDASCAGETWEVSLPILGGWVAVVLRGYVDGMTRTRQRIEDELKSGRTTAGLAAAPDPKAKKRGKAKKDDPLPPGSWSLRGAWKIDPPMLHGARAPWGWIVDGGEAKWRRTT